MIIVTFLSDIVSFGLNSFPAGALLLMSKIVWPLARVKYYNSYPAGKELILIDALLC